MKPKLNHTSNAIKPSQATVRVPLVNVKVKYVVSDAAKRNRGGQVAFTTKIDYLSVFLFSLSRPSRPGKS